MLQHPPQSPTLSGAHKGRPHPYREVPGGIYILDKNDDLVHRPAWLRLTGARTASTCVSYARQLLEARGDGKFMQLELATWSLFFQLHFALVEPPRDGGKPAPMFPLPPSISDDKGKLNVSEVWKLEFNPADGEMAKLERELGILRKTQAPDFLTHQAWEAIVNEGKEQSLRTLHSRHGSSALIQVLHGFDGSPWPE